MYSDPPRSLSFVLTIDRLHRLQPVPILSQHGHLLSQAPSKSRGGDVYQFKRYQRTRRNFRRRYPTHAVATLPDHQCQQRRFHEGPRPVPEVFETSQNWMVPRSRAHQDFSKVSACSGDEDTGAAEHFDDRPGRSMASKSCNVCFQFADGELDGAACYNH